MHLLPHGTATQTGLYYCRCDRLPAKTSDEAEYPSSHALSIGLFTHPGGLGRRQMIRTIFKPDLIANKQKIDFKFILGSPPDEDWKYALEQEE